MGSGRSVGIAARLCCVTRSCDTSIGREFTGKAPVSSSEAWALGRDSTGACWHYRWHSDSSAAAPKTPTTSLRWRPVTFREVFVKHRGFSENVSFGGIVSPVRSTSDSVTPLQSCRDRSECWRLQRRRFSYLRPASGSTFTPHRQGTRPAQSDRARSYLPK